ncbi:MAG: SET domain-containing protein-lysine N-methyltransferase [Ignavibacteriales bacterium]|nr:SET domain-containing protein-lysine N-methyltransferase [Ignavibacteriales bacterium]
MDIGQVQSSAERSVDVKASGIEGLGIFALRSFQTGERIRRINVIREITPESPLRTELGERADHCDYPDGKVVLIGFPDRHVNHSCDPNAYQMYEGGASFLVARRAIAPGEEITVDYNINITAGTAWPCNCGATRCRGLVEGDFFLLPKERQSEYRPLLADWFVCRNHDRIDLLDLELRAPLRG